jgi:hypothetical protein
LARDTGTPSADDWGSCAECGSKTIVGMMAHDVLNRAAYIAMPT